MIYQGKPVVGAQVTFQPEGEEGGRPSIAQTGKDGSFSLNYQTKLEGAKTGTHKVSVTVYGDPAKSQSAATKRLPPTEAPQTYEFGVKIVPENGARFIFELTEAA